MSKSLAVVPSATMRRGVKVVDAIFFVLLTFALVMPSNAAIFVVPTDKDMVKRADAIVVGAALTSYTQLTPLRGVETITSFSIGETIKGSFTSSQITIVEPGGVYHESGLGKRDRIVMIPGVPRLTDGQQTILFLTQMPGGRWAVTDIALGKFTFETDRAGQKLAVRAESDIAGWDPDLTPHQEVRRAADPFLAYLRSVAQGEQATVDYVVPYYPLASAPKIKIQTDAKPLNPGINSGFSATSYTASLTGAETGAGSRWFTFPSAVSFYVTPLAGPDGSATEAGAPGSGLTAVDSAFSAWSGATGASINYTRTTGTPPCAPNNCIGLLGESTPAANTITFESNLNSRYGIPAFTCNMSGYSGVLGIGGISDATGPSNNGPNGESFFTTSEVAVEMNQGIANCSLLFSNNGSDDFTSAVTHEVGHTLGFRHADQTRIDNPGDACETDMSLECAGTSMHTAAAIMRSFISLGLNGVLQPWDIHAAAAVYPAAAAPGAPTNVVATAASTTSVGITWTAPAGGGVTKYHVYRTANITSAYAQVNGETTTGTSFTDTVPSSPASYLYKVRAVNASNVESPDSNIDLATNVIFTDPTLTAQSTVVKAVHFTDLRTAVTAVCALANNPSPCSTSYTDPTLTAGTTQVKAAHLNELRSKLNASRSALSLSALSYTDGPTVTAQSTIIKAVHINELRNGVQ